MERVAKSTMTKKWMLAMISLGVLVVIFVLWLLRPDLLTSPTVVGNKWFNIYLVVGTWAVVHAIFNAIERGIVVLPQLMAPTFDRTIGPQEAAENRLGWFSLMTLIIIPIVSVPVMLSLHLELSSTQSLVSLLHEGALLTIGY
jgi:hypothetical protein